MKIAQISLLVNDYDEAIAWYCNMLGFTLVDDTVLSEVKRWVVVSPGEQGANLLLAQPIDEAQRQAVGNQTGGRVFLFLYSADFDTDYARLKSNGVHFLEEPRSEDYGKVVVFEDLYGNKWDLLEGR